MSTDTTQPMASYVDVPAIERGVAGRLRAMLADNGVETDSEELAPLFDEVERLLATPTSDPEEVAKLKKKIQKLRTSPMNQPRTLCRGHLRNTSLPCNAYRFHGYLRLVNDPDPADIAKMLQDVLPGCTAEWVEENTKTINQYDSVRGHLLINSYKVVEFPGEWLLGDEETLRRFDQFYERVWYIDTKGVIRFQSQGTPLAPHSQRTFQKYGLDLAKLRAIWKGEIPYLVTPSRFKVERLTKLKKWKSYVRIITHNCGVPDQIWNNSNLPSRWAITRRIRRTSDTVFRLSLRGTYDTPQYYYIHTFWAYNEEGDECLVVSDLSTRRRLWIPL